MGFLEALRRAVSGTPNGRSRSGAERLNLKVIRLFEEGRFREASETARQLLEAQRQELGENHPDYATALSNLALLLQRQGDLKEAEPLLRQALAVRKTLLGEAHPDCATTLNNLGELLSLRGELESAETLLRQALAIRKEWLGQGHPDYATSLSSMALLLNKRGDSAGAESMLRQALDVRREMLGEFNPDYAAGLSNLALLLFARGDLSQAEALLRQALDIRRAALGEHHPDCIATSNSLQRLLRRRGEVSRPDMTSPRTQPAREGWGVLSASAGETLPGRPPDPNSSPGRGRVDANPSRVERTEADPRPKRRPDEIAEDAALLGEQFQEAGERLLEAGQRMSSDGLYPGRDVFRDLAECHLRFSTLRAEVQGLAESRGIPCPPLEKAGGLREVDALLEAVARVAAEGSRSQALRILEQVLSLGARDLDETGLSALHNCQADARELFGIISTSPALDPPPVVDQLAAGEHPFACLLALVDHSGARSHPQRAHLQRAVAWAYGSALAEIAVQDRLFLPLETPSPQPADPSSLDTVSGARR